MAERGSLGGDCRSIPRGLASQHWYGFLPKVPIRDVSLYPTKSASLAGVQAGVGH